MPPIRRNVNTKSNMDENKTTSFKNWATVQYDPWTGWEIRPKQPKKTVKKPAKKDIITWPGTPKPKMTARQKEQFIRLFGQFAEEWNQTALEHGFDNSKTDELVQIALMHSELGEATEAIRKDITKDDHIPAYSGVEAELADVIIRAANMAAAKGLRLGEAIIAKADYNKTRSFRHGGKSC